MDILEFDTIGFVFGTLVLRLNPAGCNDEYRSACVVQKEAKSPMGALGYADTCVFANGQHTGGTQ